MFVVLSGPLKHLTTLTPAVNPGMQVSYGQGGKGGGADPAYQPPPDYSQPGYGQSQYRQGYSGHSTVVITQPGMAGGGNCPRCRVS